MKDNKEATLKLKKGSTCSDWRSWSCHSFAWNQLVMAAQWCSNLDDGGSSENCCCRLLANNRPRCERVWVTWVTWASVCCAAGWWPTGSTEPGWSRLISRRRRTDILSASGVFLHPPAQNSSTESVLFSYWLWLSTSVNGDVRFFEPRTPDSVNMLQTVKGLTALDIHPQANLFAWWG